MLRQMCGTNMDHEPPQRERRGLILNLRGALQVISTISVTGALLQLSLTPPISKNIRTISNHLQRQTLHPSTLK